MSSMESSDIRESVLINEPTENKNNIIQPFKVPTFPYILLGVVSSVFQDKFDSKKWESKGVGILIGNDVVLTSAHNLFYDKERAILIGIHFTPLIDGYLNLIKPISCHFFITPELFHELKKDKNNPETLPYDYAILFLNRSLGSTLHQLFDLSKVSELQFVEDKSQLFKFFVDTDLNSIADLEKEKKGIIDSKMSMVSYSYYKEEYLEDKKYKFTTNINQLKKIPKTRYTQQSDRNSYPSTIRSTVFSKMNETNITEGQISLEGSKVRNRDSLNIGKGHMFQTELFDYPPYYVIEDQSKRNDNSLLEETYFFDESSNILLCEAKGRLSMDLSKEISSGYYLKYLITTYKTQSGSPVFLKKNNENNSNKNKNYKYLFMGIHSKSSDFNLNYDDNEKKNYLSSTGYTNYNIGLFLNLNMRANIRHQIISMKNELNLKNKQIKFEDSFFIIEFYSYEEKIFTALFDKSSTINNLFTPVSEYYDIKQDFLLLTIDDLEITNDDYSLMSVRLSDVVKLQTSIPLVRCNIEVKVNDYSEFLITRIPRQLLYNLNKAKIAYDDLKSLHDCINEILGEIKMKFFFIYSLLFNKIQEYALNQILFSQK